MCKCKFCTAQRTKAGYPEQFWIPVHLSKTKVSPLGHVYMCCEMPVAYCCEQVRARKAHYCHECHGIIFINEIYHKHHGVWDGSGHTYKVCADCEQLRADIDKDVPFAEERTAFGCLCESVFEGREIDYMRRFLETKEKRQAVIKPWMQERFDDEFNKEDNKDETTDDTED